VKHPESLWPEDEVSRLADNSVRGLIERFAIWESGEEPISPATRRRTLEHLRRAFDREAAILDQPPTAGTEPVG
jgi:hypothetical protein